MKSIDERFVRGIMAGHSAEEAYRYAKPIAKKWKDETVATKAAEMMARKDIVKAIAKGTPIKNLSGKPGKYDAELVERARDYLINLPADETVPLISGLSRHLGVSRQTVLYWSKDNSKPEFQAVIELLEQIREIRLVTGGLTEEYNAALTRLLLMKHHNYREDSSVELSGVDGGAVEMITSDMTPERAAEIYRQALEDV